MAFEYGEEVDSSGNITHVGSWGTKSIPKDAMVRIIEDLRLVYDEPTSGTTAALALKLDMSSLPSTINSVSIGGSATGITIYDSTKLPLAGGVLTGTLTTASGMNLESIASCNAIQGINLLTTVLTSGTALFLQSNASVGTSGASYFRGSGGKAVRTVCNDGKVYIDYSSNTPSPGVSINWTSGTSAGYEIVYPTIVAFGDGYIKWSNGYTEQWGIIAIPASSSIVIAFPLGFSTILHIEQGSIENNVSSLGDQNNVIRTSSWTNGMRVLNSSTNISYYGWKVTGIIN